MCIVHPKYMLLLHVLLRKHYLASFLLYVTFAFAKTTETFKFIGTRYEMCTILLPLIKVQITSYVTVLCRETRSYTYLHFFFAFSFTIAFNIVLTSSIKFVSFAPQQFITIPYYCTQS